MVGFVAMPLKRRPSATGTVLGLLCLMYLINYIVRVNVSTAAAVFQPQLHLSNTQVGLIFSIFGYGLDEAGNLGHV